MGAWGAPGKMGQAEAAASVLIPWSGYCLTWRFKAPLTTLLASLIGSAGVNRLSGDRRQPICRSVASLAKWCAAVGRLSDDDPRTLVLILTRDVTAPDETFKVVS